MDLTPAEDALPAPYETVHGRVYVRAVVIDNGAKRMAIVAKDSAGLDGDLWAKVPAQIASEEHIAKESPLIAGTHAHAAPGGGGGGGPSPWGAP